jgi:transposase
VRAISSSVSSPPPRLISDELWALVEPLIPPRRPAVHGRTGRPRTCDRDVFEGIAFVMSTGIGWTKLPTELGYGSGWAGWRRLREWADAGVFDLHQAVLDRLGQQGGLDWSRARSASAPQDEMRRDPLSSGARLGASAVGA